MPQTIYMPQDPSAIGNVIAPAANQMSQFLWNLAGMKIKANFDAQVADTQARALEAKEKRDFARQKQLVSLRGDEARKTERVKAEVKPEQREQAMIAQYNLSKEQGYPGSFLEWRQSLAKAGATKISLGEKLALHEQKKNIDVKAKIKEPGFRNSIVTSVKAKHGPDWDDLDPYERDEVIWRESHARIRGVYPKAVFDHRRDAWFDGETGKLIRKYSGPKIDINPNFARSRGMYR